MPVTSRPYTHRHTDTQTYRQTLYVTMDGRTDRWPKIRVHIDYAISLYRSWICWRCDIASRRDQTILCINARPTRVLLARTEPTHIGYSFHIPQTMHNGDNYRRDGDLRIPDIWPVSERAPPHFPTQALFHLYFAYSASSMFKPMKTMAAAVGSGQHHNAIPTPTSCPVNRGVRIVKGWSATVHVRRPEQYAVWSMQLRPHLNATLYSVLTVETCMIKCWPTVAAQVTTRWYLAKTSKLIFLMSFSSFQE